MSSLINRSMLQEEPELARILDKFASEIDKAVDFGSGVFDWCADAIAEQSKGGKVTAESLTAESLLMMFRHALQLLDSISILVKYSAIDPCEVQLRAVLETFLNVAYLLQEDTYKRAAAFRVWSIHKKIKFLSKLDQNTEQGKQFRSKIRKDRILKKTDLPNLDSLNEEREKQEKRLTRPHFRNAEAEYQRLRNLGKRNPAWYSFYDGPQSLEELANKVDLAGMYELGYRKWSGRTHGTDIFSVFNLGGETWIEILRSPRDAQLMTSSTLLFALELYRRFIKHFTPSRSLEYKQWYLREMRDFYNRVSSDEQIIKFRES